MIEKQWLIRPGHERVQELQQALGISPITARILANRGIETIAQGENFLYANLDDLHSPWELPDMRVCVERIVQAIGNQESITIYGDYDVDGQTSTALLVRVLRRLATDPTKVHYYIPHRIEEGYGLHREALSEIATKSSLVITVDCGISAIAEANYAQELNLDLIITDHHEPGSQLPAALGIINPKRKDSNYPFAELAGVGVAYKLVQALGEYYQQDFQEYLDLVALGTVADLVPLVDENRILAKFGLQQLANSSCVGLQALIDVCRLKEPYTASDLGYRLGPRLNAVGRIGEASRGLALLLTEDYLQARELASILDKENAERQAIEHKIYVQAKEMIEANGWQNNEAIVVADEQWHPGVIGIVASRIVESYYRPTIVIGIEDGIGKASARSISGFNLFEGLSACSDLLETFGGHEMAAGLQIKAENIPLLRERLIALVAESLEPADFIPKLFLDGQANLDQLDYKLLQELNLLEPFGMKNPSPVLQVSGSIQNLRPLGDGSHVSCQVSDEYGMVKRAVGFDMYERVQGLQGYFEQLNLAVCLQPGFRDPQMTELLLRDLHPAVIPSNFIEETITQYPWNLPNHYREIALFKHELKEKIKNQKFTETKISLKDGRQQWKKTEFLLNELAHDKTALIYVATPEQALTLCRELRIAVPGDPSFIGFEHEHLSAHEQEELSKLIASGELRWLVSTGINHSFSKWEQLVYYQIPVIPELISFLANQLLEEGTLIPLYNKNDLNWYQAQIRCAYPDRNLLANFYQAMIKVRQVNLSGQQLQQIATQLSMEPGLSFALGVFAELNLIKYRDGGIRIQPKPNEKLDLFSSLLYNEGMSKCEQYFSYSQHCLERGFFNEFNGKDTDNRRLS